MIVLAEARYCGVKNTDTHRKRQDMKHASDGHNRRNPEKDSRVKTATEANLNTPDNHICPRAISNRFSVRRYANLGRCSSLGVGIREEGLLYNDKSSSGLDRT